LMVISILTRRLRPGKTYEDFRKAWYHSMGFGIPCRLYSAINVFDQREVIVVGLGEVQHGQDPMALLRTDVKERLEHPLDDVIEPDIGRRFGIVVSEDDFSPLGELGDKPASVDGKLTDFGEVAAGLALAGRLFKQASEERDEARKSGVQK